MSVVSEATVDVPFLRSWIRPEHLEGGRIRDNCRTFESHPSRLVVLPSFLVDQVAEKLSKFLSAEAVFRPEYGLYSAPDQKVSQEQWLGAVDADRFFRFGKLIGVNPEFTMSVNALTYLRFRTTFQDAHFRSFFEHLSGLPLGDSDDFGAHAMQAGDVLRSHSDDNRNRRLAIVIYLSPSWQSSYGGALHIIDSQGSVTVVDATYNTMIAFDVLAGTTHYVTPIASSAGTMPRLTIGGWYPNP